MRSSVVDYISIGSSSSLSRKLMRIGFEFFERVVRVAGVMYETSSARLLALGLLVDIRALGRSVLWDVYVHAEVLCGDLLFRMATYESSITSTKELTKSRGTDFSSSTRWRMSCNLSNKSPGSLDDNGIGSNNFSLMLNGPCDVNLLLCDYSFVDSSQTPLHACPKSLRE